VAVALGAGIPFAVALVLSPGGLWSAVTAQTDRPLQIESLGSSVLVGLSHLGLGGPYSIVWSSGSQNLVGGGVDAVTTLTSVVAILCVAGLWVAGVRGVRRAEDDRAAFAEAVRFAFAAVVAAIVFGKVLSPQFVLWLLPFPLLLAGRRASLAAGLTVAALLLTAAEFPGRYWLYANGFDGGTTAIVVGRNLVLVALLATLAAPAHGALGRVLAAPRPAQPSAFTPT
jgi:hypothetical protein